ncbi:KamA family radical SAM protein [Candidatus Thioglobus sp.]|uniref:KamA family radical SAM protein n=1 Tax=Candidatus Thioglobus sp. TaxID=2026721 RepID=UPI003D13A4C7
MNQWNHQARKALKGAKQSNDFFDIQVFEDKNFPIKIPLEYAQLIDKTNPNDPLLRQVLPQNKKNSSSYSAEPLSDEDNSPVGGLIHKYKNRVLLIASQVCAIHCQYCFRQNFNYAQHDALSNWPQIERYINDDTNINEVILSGGDPLSLSDDKLAKLVRLIETIKHIDTLRIHTRSAVVMPSRITSELAKLLNSSRLKVIMVFHVNHAQELSDDFVQQIKQLKNLTLLNQAVLLKGVNDKVACLKSLSLALIKLNILPYYLHMLDKVSGAEDYFVEDEIALSLHQQLQTELSGYLVPKLVRDSNQKSKTWLSAIQKQKL